MNSINENGCSVCQPGKENYTTYTTKLGRKRMRMYQYDYRTESGELFSCCAPTLEQCRERRDKWLSSHVIVKTCSDICFTIGQKNCQMFVAKLHKFHHPHNRRRFYPAHSVLSFPDFAVDTFLPQRFLR